MEDPYKINYEDEKFAQVEEAKDAALKNVDETYGGMLQQTDKFYDAQTEAVKNWEEKQSALRQEQTDFTIEQLQQQKDRAEEAYQKEQSAAYTDWQKQSNAYGVNAEQQADLGMQNTGYSESSRVGMYNTYQNRVATAKAAFTQAVTVYDNAMKDAALQNNAALAEIAYQSLQQQLALSLQGFQYRNQLILDKTQQQLAVENQYYNRHQDVLHQMNTENALAEQIRQHNEQLAEEQRQFNYKHRLGEFAGRSSGRSRSGTASRSVTSYPTLPEYGAQMAQDQGVEAAIDWANGQPYLSQEEKNAIIGNAQGVDMTEYYRNRVVG